MRLFLVILFDVKVDAAVALVGKPVVHDMFTQFSEISARFIQTDKSKGVKRLLFSPQYIEHKISIFNEIFNRMKEQKNLSYSLRKVIHPFKSSLNSIFLPILNLRYIPKES